MTFRIEKAGSSQTFSAAIPLPPSARDFHTSLPHLTHHCLTFLSLSQHLHTMPRPSFLLILAIAAGAVYANTQMGQTSDSSELSAQGQAAQAVFNDPLGSAPIGVGQGGPSLADALTVERRASLWFEYARDVSSIVSISFSRCHDDSSLSLPPSPPSRSSRWLRVLAVIIDRRDALGDIAGQLGRPSE